MIGSLIGAWRGYWATVGFGADTKAFSEKQQESFRARQIGLVLAIAPMAIAANFLNTAITASLLWTPSHRIFLTIWISASLGASAVHMIVFKKSASFQLKRHAKTGAVRRLTLSALSFGAVWATPIIGLFPEASESQRILLGAGIVAALGSGAVVLSPVWQAAVIYAFVIVTPAVVILCRTGEPLVIGAALLMVSFSGFLAMAIYQRSLLTLKNYLAARDLEEQSQVIGLLLKDFEENASDWLFEIDAEGRLTHISNRLARLLQRPAQELNGLPVLEFLCPGFDQSAAAMPNAPLANLVQLFRRRRAFHDVVVVVSIAGEQRWWSLTGRPMHDETGQFRGYRGVGADITEAQRAEAAIARMAHYDALTGLPNRHLINLHLTKSLERLRREGVAFCLLNLDLDRFKNINDSLGHYIGDLLLAEVGRRIKRQVSRKGFVGRFGGDEFVIVEPEAASPFDAAALAHRLVAALAKPYEINGRKILTGASVGLTLAADATASAEDILRNADLALYSAKNNGRAQYCFYTPEMTAAVQACRKLEEELRKAIDAEKLEVFFQPIFEISTGCLASCEALVRWSHPDRGYIPPAEFLPMIEDAALILELGEFVLKTACKEAAGWGREIKVAVNLSAAQFHSDDLVELVKTALSESGLAPRRLELEITESVLLRHKEGVFEALTKLHALGAQISLDNFGVGASSLACLSSFAFDKIKIDQSFIRQTATRGDGSAMVGAIAGLAHIFSMRTAAEGVEIAAELDLLRLHGCDEAQGNLLSPPLAAKDLKKLLMQSSSPTVEGEKSAA